jgi:hypothetical protein
VLTFGVFFFGFVLATCLGVTCADNRRVVAHLLVRVLLLLVKSSRRGCTVSASRLG